MSSSIPVPQQLNDDIRVLHVDDEPDLGEMVATFLERANDRLHVETATNPEEALDILPSSDFDCVVSDYDMPGKNGVEFLETLRTTNPSLPFILYTGKGSEEVASKALTAGATDYLQKESGTDHYSVLANRIVTVVERERVQIKMDEVQHLFTELADRANDVLWLMTHDWSEVVFTTQAYEAVFGQSRERLKDDPTAFLDVIHPEDRHRVEAGMGRLTEGESIDIEFRIDSSDDPTRWVWIKADPITDPTGRVTHVGGFGRDITEKKTRELELETTNAQLKAAIEAGGVGTWEWDVQTDTLVVGPAFARTFDIDPDEAADGLPVSQFLAAIHEDDRSRVEAAIDDALANCGPCEIEYRVRNADDEVRWVTARGHVECNDDGTPCRVPGSLIDITDRKAREDELLDTQRQYEAMFEDPNILVGVLALDGTVKDINQTAMDYIDTTLDAVRGERFWETPWFGDDPETKRDVRAWVEAAAAGEYVPFEADITTEDGFRIVNGMFRPVVDDSGEVTEIIVSDRDITERRLKERRLEESESRYRALAENFPNGIVTMFDDDLTYTLAAGQAFETLPVTEADVEGSHPSDVWGTEIGADVEAAFRDALSGTATAVETSYENREWIIHAVPITDEQGDVLGGMTIAQDITEQTRYQSELERALELMERAERIADVGSWEIDADTKDVFWSQNLFEILDRDGEEPPLEDALDVYHEEDRVLVANAVESA
jgi:PAS domain S-box-containing protein